MSSSSGSRETSRSVSASSEGATLSDLYRPCRTLRPRHAGACAPILVHARRSARRHAAPSDRIGLALSCTCNVYVSNDMTPKSTNVQPSETDTAERRAASRAPSVPRPSRRALGEVGRYTTHAPCRNLSPRLAASRLSWVIERRSKWTAAFSRLSHREAPNLDKMVMGFAIGPPEGSYSSSGVVASRPTPTKKSWRSPLKMSRTPKKKGSTDENAAPNHTTATAQQTAEAKAKYLEARAAAAAAAEATAVAKAKAEEAAMVAAAAVARADRLSSRPPSAVSGSSRPASALEERLPAPLPPHLTSAPYANMLPFASPQPLTPVPRMAEPQDAIEVARRLQEELPTVTVAVGNTGDWITKGHKLLEEIGRLMQPPPPAASCSLMQPPPPGRSTTKQAEHNEVAVGAWTVLMHSAVRATPMAVVAEASSSTPSAMLDATKSPRAIRLRSPLLALMVALVACSLVSRANIIAANVSALPHVPPIWPRWTPQRAAAKSSAAYAPATADTSRPSCHWKWTPPSCVASNGATAACTLGLPSGADKDVCKGLGWRKEANALGGDQTRRRIPKLSTSFLDRW